MFALEEIGVYLVGEAGKKMIDNKFVVLKVFPLFSGLAFKEAAELIIAAVLLENRQESAGSRIQRLFRFHSIYDTPRYASVAEVRGQRRLPRQ